MALAEAEHRVAVLLNLLGSELAEPILATLSSENGERVRQCLQAIKDSPPTDQEADEVVEDFERFFRLAHRYTKTLLRIAPETSDGRTDLGKDADARNDEEESLEEEFAMSEDPLADLSRMDAFRVAGALREESPRTISLVLSCVDADKAAEILRQLPAEMQGPIFLQFGKQPPASRGLIERIVRATVEKGCSLDRESLESRDVDTDQRMADMLRSMDKQLRSAMLETLEEQEPETAMRIKDLLYVFDDLSAVQDRSLQKLLAEVDTQTLATALYGADEKLINKIFGNLSRRARQSITEEMDLLGSLSEETVEGARNIIVEVLARLDQSGDLMMEP